MKVALIGYGKMGQSIEPILIERGHEVIAKFGVEGIDRNLLKTADVAIEFTKPDSAFNNVTTCFNLGVPVVSGTTGWQEQMEEALEYCITQKGAFIFASNFSLGVNLFFALNSYLAKLMKPHDGYKVDMQEIHHVHKKDAPSGTAIRLATNIMTQRNDLQSWRLKEDVDEADQIPIESIRENEVPGTHSVNYRSSIDDIEIKHTAHSRKGFALGAVIAAEYLNGKTGVYSMRDVLNLPS